MTSEEENEKNESVEEEAAEVENCLQEYPPMDEKLVNLGELG